MNKLFEFFGIRLIFLIIAFVIAGNVAAQTSGIPSWALQSNIYEVNLRQYTKSGTFNEFVTHLPRLKEMGVQILWFMPVTPIGKEGRKMTEKELGSYYAVRNYKQTNEEYGSMQDWKDLVRTAHKMGFKVITDWVANHSAPDNPWIKNHPDFYAKDSAGKMIAPFDWTDVRKLDYNNPVLRDSMIAAMKFWITETGIDGFRCDVASEVPISFWKTCIEELKKVKDVYMLAEGESPALHTAGFHTTYAWNVMHTMTDLYAGKKTVQQFDSVLSHNINSFPKDATRLFFTTNHDENSWNGTEFEKYGEAHKAFAVLTHTMAQSIPLIYSGQEMPNKKRLKFFVRDPIEWTGNYEMAPFYKKLLSLRRNNKALSAFAEYKRIPLPENTNLFAYYRMAGREMVVVILNMSADAASFAPPVHLLKGKAKDVFTGKKKRLSGTKQMLLPAWGYAVYAFKFSS